MWIESEPADMLMTRYFLCFEPGDPNPEDGYVRAYLRDHRLAPKRTWRDERLGTACEVLQFGQCYLGFHLGVVQAMRVRGIVAEAVGNWLREIEGTAPAVRGLDAGQQRELAWALAG